MDFSHFIVGPVMESLMAPIMKEFRYVISYTKYMRDMHTKMSDLDHTRQEVESHIDRNKISNLEIPSRARYWLEEIGMINEKIRSMPSDGGSCFNLLVRYKISRKASKIIKDIDRLTQEHDKIYWTDHQIPLGKVDFMKASSSTPSNHLSDFKSREWTFMEALKALEPYHKSHMIALCGIGGIGKTTMMEKLKKVVIEKRMFDFIIEATIGENINLVGIQQTVAEYLGIDLKESSLKARASKLRKTFEAYFDGGRKILVILDDIWQVIDMNDIGLSLFPNQGVDFKVLLTSRNRNVCIKMGVEVNSILNVEFINDLEAKSLFHQVVKISDDDDLDLDLRKIGDDIASRCQGLPIAIQAIAFALKGKSKHVWEDKLSNFMVDNVVHQTFEKSYRNLQNEETRSTLLLCGLFPEDFDTPTEDLVMYSWGLRLFSNVHTMREARNRLNACIEELIHASLLIESEDVGCVKMHNVVRDFILAMCSKGEHASVVGGTSKWATKDTRESCKRISLTCTGMTEFPRDLKFPNLLLLKLIHGDKSLRFPQDFYEEMKKLEVIAYDIMEGPLLSKSLQCATNLRTLCLHRCSLMFDLSPIGDLLNLEVLSFAHCSIQKLSSTLKNLKELKLLDLTGCVDLRIDDGVLKNLVKLEELYMRVSERKGIRFTNANGDELVECAKKLIALEIEFFDNDALPKNMSFKKLERFKISLGCYLKENDGQSRHSFENTLMLVTNKCELMDSRMNELFEKTKVLHLVVDDINNLGDVLVEPLHHHQSSFHNLRVLDVFECANLKYLFSVRVANGLTMLERLTISFCPVLETLVDSENSGIEAIKFQSLKFLSLGQLPKLTSLCNAINVIELPQLEELILYSLPNLTCIYPDNESSTSSMSNDISAKQPFLKEEVVMFQLKILKIFYMKNLKEIWPSKLSDREVFRHSILKVITVEGCDSLVNLFPSNPMSLLHHLEELKVWNCGSIDVLFNIDLECVGEIEEESNSLRYIEASGLGKLRAVWRVKGVNNSNLFIPGFQSVEYIIIRRCKNLRNVFTPTTIDFGMSAHMRITIDGIDGWGENQNENEIVESI